MSYVRLLRKEDHEIDFILSEMDQIVVIFSSTKKIS